MKVELILYISQPHYFPPFAAPFYTSAQFMTMLPFLALLHFSIKDVYHSCTFFKLYT